MTRAPVIADPETCGLYRGVPAVAFTLHAAGQPVYADALAVLDGHVATITRHRLTQAHERIDCGRLPELREFDLDQRSDRHRRLSAAPPRRAATGCAASCPTWYG